MVDKLREKWGQKRRSRRQKKSDVVIHNFTRSTLDETFWVDFTRLDERSGTQITKLDGGRFRVRCKGQHCGIKNRNNRVYPTRVWKQHTDKGSDFMAKVKSRRVTGQLEHPSDGKSAMSLAAIVIVKVEPPDADGAIYVTFETMSTEAGKVASAFIRDGVGFGISSRGNGSVAPNRGVDEVQDDYEPVTFDLVIDESTPGAEIHAQKLKESYRRLMESAGGDPLRARNIDRAMARRVMKEDCADSDSGDQFLLSLRNGAGHYRAFESPTGDGTWEVHFKHHNKPPKIVAHNLKTLDGSMIAAKKHATKVAYGIKRRAMADYQQSVKEGYSIKDTVPFNGTAFEISFDSEPEMKKGQKALMDSGFHARAKEDNIVIVYTSYEDANAGQDHVDRVLDKKGLNSTTESVGVIESRRVTWEDPMSGLNEHGYDDHEDYEEDYDGMDEGGYADVHDEDYDDMDEYAEVDGSDDDYDGDDPEDLDLDHDLSDGMYEEDDEDDEDDDDDADEGYYGESSDVSDAFVLVEYDEDGDAVRAMHYDEDGILEGIEDEGGYTPLDAELIESAVGEAIEEVSGAAARAMFAKGFSRNPRIKKWRNSDKKTKEYYKGFREKYPGSSKHGRKLSGKKIKGNIRTVSKDKRTRGTEMTKKRQRPYKPKAQNKKKAQAYARKQRRAAKKSKKESIEFIRNNDGLVEVWDNDIGLPIAMLSEAWGDAGGFFGKMFGKGNTWDGRRERDDWDDKTATKWASTYARKYRLNPKYPGGRRILNKAARTKNRFGKPRQIQGEGPYQPTAAERAKYRKKMGAAKKPTKRKSKKPTKRKGGKRKSRNESYESYEHYMDEMYGRGGGDAVALKMRGNGGVGRGTSQGNVGARGGGDPVALKRKKNERKMRERRMRERYEEDYDYDELEALREENARQRDMIEAMTAQEHEQSMDEALQNVISSHPELSAVASRLQLCESVEELNTEAASLLAFRRSALTGTGNQGNDRVINGGAAVAPLNEGATDVFGGNLLTENNNDADDVMGRVADYRRRQKAST